MQYIIPGRNDLTINTIILDLNGTLQDKGVVVVGVKERLHKLKELGFGIVFFTGNTRNDADEISKSLEIEWRLAKDAEAKAEIAKEFKVETCATIGNGKIDVLLMKECALSICVMQKEGASRDAMLASEIWCQSINDALDLFIDKNSLIATLRN